MNVFYSACDNAELSIAQCFHAGIWHNYDFLSVFGDGGGSCSTRTIVESEGNLCIFGTWDSFSVSNFYI